MNLQDLITVDGKLSHHKFWVHIAYITATACVLFESYRNTLEWEMLLVYLAIVGGSSVASKFLDMKYGQK
jgi:hypothetical protein